jgi:Protein of Unknown function (DUF2604)
MKPEKLDLTVVVNGTPTQIEGNLQAELRTVVTRALAETKNSGQPFENWELRDASGKALDLGQKVGQLSLSSGATLFLSLRAGIGG